MLTFEIIRELEREEKASKKPKKLPENLLEELREYIKRKERNAEKTASDMLELENVRNTIRRFFEMREKKIVDMALSTARTGLPPENLTNEEEKVFYDIAGAIKKQREAFFFEVNREPDKEQGEEPPEEKKERVIYRVRSHLPEFVGPDMKTYRLVRGEIVNLPKPLNDLLLKEGILEEIRE